MKMSTTRPAVVLIHLVEGYMHVAVHLALKLPVIILNHVIQLTFFEEETGNEVVKVLHSLCFIRTVLDS